MGKREVGGIFYLRDLATPESQIPEALSHLEAMFHVSKHNPVLVWEALAILLADGRGLPLPAWVTAYLRDTALTIREIAARVDPKYAPGQAVAALGFARKGTNAFASRAALDKMRNVFAEFLRLKVVHGTASAAYVAMAPRLHCQPEEVKRQVAAARRWGKALAHAKGREFNEAAILKAHMEKRAMVAALKEVVPDAFGPRVVPKGSKEASGKPMPKTVAIPVRWNRRAKRPDAEAQG